MYSNSNNNCLPELVQNLVAYDEDVPVSSKGDPQYLWIERNSDSEVTYGSL